MRRNSRPPETPLKPAILTAIVATLALLGLAAFAVDAASVPDWALFLGRLHPALLHLPIGFLGVLGIIEFLDSRQGGPRIGRACEIVVKYTAIVAALAAILGIFLGLPGGYNEELLERHRWLGCLTAVLAFWLVVLRAHARNQRRDGFSLPYHGALGVTLILLFVVGHDGGTLTHGSGYLTKYLPAPLKAAFGMESSGDAKGEGPSFETADVYTDLIHPIWEETCISCHGPDKSKGDLRLDTYELAMQGGEVGDTIIPGDAEGSELVFRFHLDIDDDERMPPEGKPQPSEAQIAIVEWWIQAGAPGSGLLSALEIPDALKGDIIAQLGKPPVEAIAADEEEEADIEPWEAIAEQVALLDQDPKISIRPVSQDSAYLNVKAAFGEHRFDDEALAQLGPVASNILELEIGFSDVTDDGLAALEEMVNLERLYLQKTQITDAGMAHLENLDKLRYLNLYGTQVTDAALESLQNLDKLQSLYLWGTQVSEQAAKEFKENKLDHAQIEAWEEEIQALKLKIQEAGILVETGADAEPGS